MPTRWKFLVPLIVRNSTIFLLCIQWLWIPFASYFCKHKKTPSSSSLFTYLRLYFSSCLNFLRRYSKGVNFLISTLLIFKNSFHSLSEKVLKHLPESTPRTFISEGYRNSWMQTINQILIISIPLYQSLLFFSFGKRLIYMTLYMYTDKIIK